MNSASKPSKLFKYFNSIIPNQTNTKHAIAFNQTDLQSEHVINNYNLKGHITIKNLNNISIENVMLQSPSIDSKLKYEPVLMTEPTEPQTKPRYKWQIESKAIHKKKPHMNHNNSNDSNFKQRNLSGGNERVNQMIIHLRDEFNQITNKNWVRRQDTFQDKCNTEAHTKDIDNNNDNEDKESICSMNSFLEDIHCYNTKNIEYNMNKLSRSKFNNKKKLNTRNNLISYNNTQQNKSSFKPNIGKAPIAKQKICTTASKNNNRTNSAKYNPIYSKNETFGSNGSNASSNCINKQIAFSIRSTRDRNQETQLLIQKQQEKIHELEFAIKLFQEFIRSQQTVFINHCKTAITPQINKQDSYLLMKEKEINSHLIKENNLFKQLIQTIIAQICKVIINESIQINKDNHIISRIIKENEYLRKLNSSITHILIRTDKDNYNELNNTNPIKKKSFSNCKKSQHDSRVLTENEPKSRNLLSLSLTVNKNLEETIKKLAECKSVNEIEKISSQAK